MVNKTGDNDDYDGVHTRSEVLLNVMLLLERSEKLSSSMHPRLKLATQPSRHIHSAFNQTTNIYQVYIYTKYSDLSPSSKTNTAVNSQG